MLHHNQVDNGRREALPLPRNLVTRRPHSFIPFQQVMLLAHLRCIPLTAARQRTTQFLYENEDEFSIEELLQSCNKKRFLVQISLRKNLDEK